MHKNTEIRNEIIDIIEASSIVITAFNSRSITTSSAKLPAVVVFPLDENAEETPDQGGYIRNVEVNLVIYAKGKDVSELDTGEISIEETVDNLQEEFEDLFLTLRQNLNAKVFSFKFTGAVELKETENVESAMIIRQMSFVAQYHFNIT